MDTERRRETGRKREGRESKKEERKEGRKGRETETRRIGPREWVVGNAGRDVFDECQESSHT